MTQLDGSYLFVGVGGMGMAPLAAWMAHAGYTIHGYDDQLREQTRRSLVESGVELCDFIFPRQLDHFQTVVYSSAIAPSHTILKAARARGLRTLRRGEMLAEIAQHKQLIAIVGSHGKTTTAGMVAHALRECGIESNYILGGYCNDPTLPPSRYTASEWLIAEVDESDGTIEHFTPEVTVVLNIDWDHADHYASEAELEAAFRGIVARTTGRVFVPAELRCGLEGSACAEIATLQAVDAYGVAAPLVGRFNAVNAAAALAVVDLLASVRMPPSVLSTFSGMARRQKFLHQDVQLSIVEDYAHHPTEIAALLRSLRERAPDHKLVVVFQPHRYSRTKQFKDAFATSLAAADQVFLLPVYAAHEPSMEGGDLVNLSIAFGPRPPEVLTMDRAGMYQLANRMDEVPTTLAFVGAGDIDQLAAAFTEMTRTGFTASTAWLQFIHARISVDCRVREHEPLANKTTLRVGGAARYYVEPSNLSDLQALVRGAKLFGIKTFCLGRGSNLVVPDEGFDGLVIRFNSGIWRGSHALGEGRIWAAAGVRLKEICGFAAKAGLSGFEFLEGIPGSVGGALRMNAGAMGSWMFDVVERVQLLDSEGNLQDLPKEAFHFGYRKVEEISRGIALGAVLKSPEDAAVTTIRERMDTYSVTRKASQPRDPSAGCIFKNPDGNYAGQLIDRHGIKGMRVGDAEVSTVHGNFIVNRGEATAKDIIELVRQVRIAVFKQSGYVLEPEVLLLGQDWDAVLGPIEEGVNHV
ncbi:MAG: UDP-N-acetylmuramate dehydrogenase [Opitutales bacterium]